MTWPGEFAQRCGELGPRRDRAQGSILRDNAEKWRERTALVDRDHHWTCRALDAWTDRVVGGLCAQVQGRKKHVINRGGDKTPVEEAETFLLGHPEVHDVAIIGVPDGLLGERSCECVIAKSEPPACGELVAYLTCLGVAAFKLPDQVRVLESFPRTAVGKVDRKALAR